MSPPSRVSGPQDARRNPLRLAEVGGGQSRDADAAAEVNSRSALRRSLAPQFRYDVTVIADDAGDVAHCAGGWIADRVRAGWRVSALLPADRESTPLHILGVSVEHVESDTAAALLTPPPATLALRAPVTELPDRIAALVSVLLAHHDTEIAVWGEDLPDCPRRLDLTHHQLSFTARAFKAHAVQAAGLRSTVAPVEVFRSCAPWYRPDAGADLRPGTIPDTSADSCTKA